MPANPKVEGEWACTECQGTGVAVPDCETCDGNGWVDDEEDGGTMTCPDCLGDRCEACNGSGEAAGPEVKEIEIA